jgi:hypothetical protein
MALFLSNRGLLVKPTGGEVTPLNGLESWLCVLTNIHRIRATRIEAATRGWME